MYRRIYFLIIKEFLAVWQDKKTRLFLILPPLIQLFVFSFAATLDVKNVPIGVLNKDSGKEAFELIQRFKGSVYFPYIRYLNSEKEIQQFIDRQKVIMVVHIDETFSKNLLNNKEAKVQLILDGRKSNTAQIVQGYAVNIIQRYNLDLRKNKDLSSSIIIPRNWFNPNLIYLWFTVPGLVALLTMITAILVTSLSIARERELGTFDQLLVSPLTPFDILIGKAVPGIIIGMGEGTLILIAAIAAFQIPFTGSLLALYFSIFIFVCSIVGFGLFLSSLCNTQQQALLASFVFISNIVILSGFATPIENMPVWLQKITYLNPLRFILVIVRGIFLKEFPFAYVLKNLVPIVFIAIFSLSFSTWFFRKRTG